MTLFDPAKGLIGTALGSPTERLGYRTVEQNRRTRVVERRQAAAWAGLPFRNGWGNYSAAGGAGNDWRQGEYRRTADGTVELRGLITKFPFGSGQYIAYEAIAVLPAVCAPLPSVHFREMLNPLANGGGIDGIARLETYRNTDGTAVLMLVAGAPAQPVGWVNLNSLQWSTH